MYAAALKTVLDALPSSKELPQPDPHLHRVNPRIGCRQPGIRNMLIPHLGRPRVLSQKMHPERHAGSEVDRRSSRRHLMGRKERSTAQLKVGRHIPPRRKNPFQGERIHSRPIGSILRLKHHKCRYRIHRILESSTQESRTMGRGQNPAIPKSRIPQARILGPARNRMTAPCPHLNLVPAFLRTILCNCQRKYQDKKSAYPD